MLIAVITNNSWLHCCVLARMHPNATFLVGWSFPQKASGTHTFFLSLFFGLCVGQQIERGLPVGEANCRSTLLQPSVKMKDCFPTRLHSVSRDTEHLNTLASSSAERTYITLSKHSRYIMSGAKLSQTRHCVTNPLASPAIYHTLF